MTKSGPRQIKVLLVWKNEINRVSTGLRDNQLDQLDPSHPPFVLAHQTSSKSHTSPVSPIDLLPSRQDCSFLLFRPFPWVRPPLQLLPHPTTNKIATFSCPIYATPHILMLLAGRVSARVWHVPLWPQLSTAAMPKSVLDQLSKHYEPKLR